MSFSETAGKNAAAPFSLLVTVQTNTGHLGVNDLESPACCTHELRRASIVLILLILSETPSIACPRCTYKFRESRRLRIRVYWRSFAVKSEPFLSRPPDN